MYTKCEREMKLIGLELLWINLIVFLRRQYDMLSYMLVQAYRPIFFKHTMATPFLRNRP